MVEPTPSTVVRPLSWTEPPLWRPEPSWCGTCRQEAEAARRRGIDAAATMDEHLTTMIRIASGDELTEDDARTYGGGHRSFVAHLKSDLGYRLTREEQHAVVWAGFREIEVWSERARVRREREAGREVVQPSKVVRRWQKIRARWLLEENA